MFERSMHEKWFLTGPRHQVISDAALICINWLEMPCPFGIIVSLSLAGERMLTCLLNVLYALIN